MGMPNKIKFKNKLTAMNRMSTQCVEFIEYRSAGVMWSNLVEEVMSLAAPFGPWRSECLEVHTVGYYRTIIQLTCDKSIQS